MEHEEASNYQTSLTAGVPAPMTKDQVRPTFDWKGVTLRAHCAIVCGHTINCYVLSMQVPLL